MLVLHLEAHRTYLKTLLLVTHPHSEEYKNPHLGFFQGANIVFFLEQRWLFCFFIWITLIINRLCLKVIFIFGKKVLESAHFFIKEQHNVLPRVLIMYRYFVVQVNRNSRDLFSII